MKLELGSLQEAVEVTVATEGVNVTSGGVTQKLQKEVLEIPNLNRYGFANATLMPAIQQSEERRETINASVAGNTSNRNAFYIDGAEATDPWRGWSPRQPVVDAFEEIVVNTAGATVDVGSNFGGTYNAIFKSGTNSFHGSGWYFFRDKGLNANSWVNNRVGLEKPDDPLKYWGGQVGGPILKDKLFFYVTASRETDMQPYSQAGLFAPTAAMVGGDFSGVPFTIYDPNTGQPFPGNVIPSARIDSVSKAFWDAYGYNIPSYGPNYSFQFANERKVWNFNGRVDYNISQAHRLTLSGYYFENKTTSPDARVQSISGSATGGTSGNTFQKGGNELSEFPQTVFNAKWTWTPSSNLVIETRAAYSSMPEKGRARPGLAGHHPRHARGKRPAAASRRPRDPAHDRDRQLVGRRGRLGALQRLDHGLHRQEPDLRLVGHLDQGLAQHQGRRRVPERGLQHDQAGPREQQPDELQRQRDVPQQPVERRQGSDLRPRVRRLPARPLRHLRSGRRLRPDAAVLEPRHLRDGHLARDTSADRHARPAPRGKQRYQRGREPAHALPARPAVDDVPELPAGRRGARGRRPSQQLLGHLDQDRSARQLRLGRAGQRQDGRPGVGWHLLRPRRDGALRDLLPPRPAVHRRERHRAQRPDLEPLADQPEPAVRQRAAAVLRPERRRLPVALPR